MSKRAKVTQSGNTPWFTRDGVNLEALAKKAGEHGKQVRPTGGNYGKIKQFSMDGPLMPLTEEQAGLMQDNPLTKKLIQEDEEERLDREWEARRRLKVRRQVKASVARFQNSSK